MRIAYLTDIDLWINSGVRQKHLMQVATWNRYGHTAKIFCIPHVERIPDAAFEIDCENYEIFDTKLARLFKKGFAAYIRKIFVVNAVIKSLRRFSPDIIYERSTTWYPGLDRILSKFPSIIEYNALLEKELEVTSKSRVRLMHSFGNRRLADCIKGIVGVTDEITKYYTTLYNKPGITVGNGYDLGQVSAHGIHKGEGKRSPSQLIFVSSPGMIWHGIDKLFELSEYLEDVNFHLVGPYYEKQRPNFIQHGYLSKNELFELYSKMDIGVGTLAFHRNNLTQASPLKVREYLAFGLPVILAYKDVDLSGQDFVLEIDNTEDTITRNIQKIRNFINAWKGHRISRERVERLIGYAGKEQKRLDFMNTLLTQKSIRIGLLQ
ncbi:glycosyltransferase family protein [Compostibacter hankyongensis]|uniref:Spore protein YkvP/CgeB glycosyl transferase-like domain-containing protein n=1 Tax=Compostibacter hankyongensis TaxID=1007089 RepID=A0ABP8FV50_9BACT